MRVPPWTLWLALTCGVACSSGQPAQKPSSATPAAPAPEPPGTLHTVASGDTLWSLAVRYSSTVDEIQEVNGLPEGEVLSVGQVLFIPAPDPMAPAPPPGGAPPAAAAPEPSPPPAGSRARFDWPLREGVLFSGFGPRQGAVHDGIDLGAPEGTDILAADDGTVIFAGSNQGAFGNLVILKHADDFVTVYAHNRSNTVKEGDEVKRGQVLGQVGATGEAQTPHVHFEVRLKRKPVDPERLLPVE